MYYAQSIYPNTGILLQHGYIINVSNHNEPGKKRGDRARAKWEIERYKRVGIPIDDLKILMQVKHNATNLDADHYISPLKFGKASLMGLPLIIGDLANILLAYWDVYLPARKESKAII